MTRAQVGTEIGPTGKVIAPNYGVCQMPVIVPTVGRVVHFYPHRSEYAFGFCTTAGKPHAAIVTYVHSDTMVNLAVFDTKGETFPETSVPLRQPEAEKPIGSYWCEWMPFQIGQVQKTEAAEKELAAAKGSGLKTAVVALVALCLFSGDASAGPIRDRLKARFGPPASACSTCAPAAKPAYLPEVQAVQYVRPTPAPVVAAPAASSCPGGVCPAPATAAPVRRGLFR